MVIEKQRDQPLAALLICVIKARKKGAVEIEDAPDDAVLNQRDDEFGARIRIASNVAREIVDIRYQHRRGACRGGAADPLAYGDPHAGRFSLERTEHQLRAVAEIKAGPVEVGQGVIDQRASVGGVRVRPEITKSTFDRIKYGCTTLFAYHIWCE